jgi:MFS family permease
MPQRRGPLAISGSFTVFWTARTVSWAGSGISGVVLPVLVYDQTRSPALTSLLAAAEALPYLAFGLLAGAVADRFARRRLMAGRPAGPAVPGPGRRHAGLGRARAGFGVALAAVAAWLFCYSMVTVNGIALRQELTPDRLQSRVNTAARMLGWGGFPLGALIGGAIAEVLPVRVTLLIMCTPAAAAALAGLRSPLNRRMPVSGAAVPAR